MHQQGSPSSFQLKNEEFKNEIRSRMRADHMKKIRTEFLKLQQLGIINTRVYENGTIEDLMSLTTQACNQTNIARMNRMIINLNSQISESNYESLLGYFQINFLTKESAYLINKLEITDLIALLANLLAFKKHRHILLRETDMQQVVNKMFELLSLSEGDSFSSILWILFQVVELFPQSIQKISEAQMGLKQKFGLSNVYLSYLICSISELRPELVRTSIVLQYAQVPINSETDKHFCSNIIMILGLYLLNNNTEKTDKEVIPILKWISHCLPSKGLEPESRMNLINLLYCIISKHSTVPVVINLINQSAIVSELIGRSLYDSSYKLKHTCIECLNNIVRVSPNLQLSQLVEQNPSLVEAIVSWLTLREFPILIDSLKSFCKIIMILRDSPVVIRVLHSYELRAELQTLEGSDVPEIAGLATVIIEDYLE